MARIIRFFRAPCVPKRGPAITIDAMDQALRQWALERLAEVAGGASDAPSWHPLRVEASHRRFYRLEPPTPGSSYVVMSSPPALENNRQFAILAELFRRHHVGVPKLLAEDQRRGYFLLSDLGRTHFEDVYAGAPEAVVPAALDTLHRLQQIHDPRIPPYTRQRFEDELGIYVAWFLGELMDEPVPPGLDDVFATLLEAIQAQPVCCVHRDFHARNLLLTPSGGVGVVDFQDALMGPAAYDLASLLRDCYHQFPEEDVARWRHAYLTRTALPVDRSRFARDLDLTALQRQLKAVGIFARLHLRDARDTHLEHIVPVLTRIGELASRYPELAPLAEHVAGILPAARRRLENTA